MRNKSKCTIIELPCDLDHHHLPLLRQQVSPAAERILIDARRVEHVDSNRIGLLVMAFPRSNDDLPISIINARCGVRGILEAAMMDGYFIVE